MAIERSAVHHIRSRGAWACYTRPEYRTERVSNVVGSHAAYEGELSQVLGGSHWNKSDNRYHPVRYQIEQVAMLFVPRLMPMPGNEVKSFGTGASPITTGGGNHTLRTTNVLAGEPRTVNGERVAGVDYVISFRIEARSRADLAKYTKMFSDRMRNGSIYGHPCHGLKEYPALLDPVLDFRALSYPTDMKHFEHADGLKTADYNADLGLCFYGTDWDNPRRPNYFAPLRIIRGIVKYPTWDVVRSLGIKSES